MNKRPTIWDVAKVAGVSKSTVSLVLRGSDKVKPETVETVQAAMQDIGYVYNRHAAHMRTNNTGLVGLVINELRNPFFTEIATALQMAFSAKNYATVIANADENPKLQRQIINAIVEHGVAGVVVSPTPTADTSPFEHLTQHRIPVLQITRSILADTETYPVMRPDNTKGGALAAKHLITKGAARIAYVGGDSSVSATLERRQGYLDALAANDMPPFVLEGRSSREFGHDMALRLASEHPEIDGAVCFNDLVAAGMVAGCARIGRVVGEDFQVTGFDDIRECAEGYPSLTTIRVHIEAFGKQVAATMLDWIERKVKPAPDTRTEVALIARESTRA